MRRVLSRSEPVHHVIGMRNLGLVGEVTLDFFHAAIKALKSNAGISGERKVSLRNSQFTTLGGGHEALPFPGGPIPL